MHAWLSRVRARPAPDRERGGRGKPAPAFLTSLRKRRVHRKFKALLHDYKKEVFHAEHDKQSIDEITAECLHLTEDVLKQNYSYHFHKLPDANRAEIINMINNYTREAIMPPVVERLVRRQIVIEKRLEAIVHLVEQLFEVISSDAKGEAVAS